MWPSSSSNKPPSPPSSSPFPFNLPKLPDFPDLPIKLPDDDKKLILSATVLTTSFCTIQLVTQRVLGLVKMHGGRPMLVTTLVGSLLTATNLLLSQQAEKFVQQQTDNYGTLTAKGNSGKFSFGLQGKGAQRKAEMKDNLRRMYLGLGTFLLLEQGAFRTVFPSSILTLGVFANNANMLRRSVVSTSAIATESQRAKIQKLGKRFGCHHCGSRQLFAKEVFIADHMPPTKQANEMAKAWWRRLLKIEVRLVCVTYQTPTHSPCQLGEAAAMASMLQMLSIAR